MERNREGRRGSMAAISGGGLSRRRQRSSGLRDSPDDDGSMDTSRLRERWSKRDRDRDRSSRSKRRRADRLMHGGGSEEVEESSDESLGDGEEEDDEDQSMSHRHVAQLPATSRGLSSSSASQNAHLRRSFPPGPSSASKPLRPPLPVMKAAVSIPRKARSASVKRSVDSSVSGGIGGSGGGGTGQIHHHNSTSPARPNTASIPQVRPSSSTSTIRKKFKSVGGPIQRPIINSTSAAPQEDIEFEVAEVLFGMTRQFQAPNMQENNMINSKDSNGSMAASPKSQLAEHQQPPFPNQDTTVPAETLSSIPLLPVTPLMSSSTVKFEAEEETLVMAQITEHLSSSEVNGSIVKGRCQPDLFALPLAVVTGEQCHGVDKSEENQEAKKLKMIGVSQADDHVMTAAMETVIIGSIYSADLPNSNFDEIKDPEVKSVMGDDTPDQEDKFSIDLMAPPPRKLSPERDDSVQVDMPVDAEIGLLSKMDDSRRGDKEIAKELLKISPGDKEEKDVVVEYTSLKKLHENLRPLDLELELEKPDKEIVGASNIEVIKKQQLKSPKMEAKQERTVSHPLQMPSGWPPNIAPFGWINSSSENPYMGQLSQPMQSILPTDQNSGASRQLPPINILPPQRPKLCMTHCCIAQTIHYYQQLVKTSHHLWPSAAMQLYGTKQCNLNALPPLESVILGSSQQGSLPRNLGLSQDKGSSSGGAGCMGHSTPEKNLATNNSHLDTTQRNSIMLQPTGQQPGSANNMLQGPTFIFLDGAATAVGVAARPGVQKSTHAVGNAAPSSITPAITNIANSGAGTAPPTMNFNYAGLSPNDAQYFAMLQNSAYPFPNPSHVGASPYRASSLAQALPFYGGSFYPPQVIHYPSQLQQVPQIPAQHKQGNQNTSTSSGSSSSQKHPQHSQHVPGCSPGTSIVMGSSHRFPAPKQGKPLANPSTDDRRMALDNRVLPAQKDINSHNLMMPIHPQNFSLISPAQAVAVAAASFGNSGGRSEKQTAVQHHGVKVELAPSQAYAMSFAGVAPAATGASSGGLDFSVVPQNFFQSLSDAARHGYQAVQSAGTSHTMQKVKKIQTHDDGNSLGDSLNASIVIEENRKMITSAKIAAGGSPQPLMFSRSDNEHPGFSILSNSALDNSSRTLNLIPAANAGVLTPHLSSNSIPITSSSTATVGSPNSQQQQQMVQFQKQQHQLNLQHQFASRTMSVPSNNSSVHTERLPGSSTMSKFPQTLSSFPQALIQGSGSGPQSPQWKGTSRPGATLVSSPSATLSSKGQHLPQQQIRVPQQYSNSAHHTQISFGVNPINIAGSMGQSNLPSLSSANPILAGSFPSSLSKSGGGGSPQRSSSGKSSSRTPTLAHSQQSSDKVSQSSSILKPSSGNNRSITSVTGHHHITPAPISSSSSKPQHSSAQQKAPYPATQLFFSSSYMPGQPAQSNVISSAAVAGYFKRHPSELLSHQPQQQNASPASMGLLSLCSSGLTLSAAPATNDPAKAMVAAANLKVLQAPGLLQHPSQTSTAAPYSLISGAGAGFPYIHAMPSLSVKPSEQKSAAGNDSVTTVRQADKR